MRVTREDENGIATLTLNRPDKLNAIDIPLMAELRAHVDALASDASVGCVVLTGAGRSFCAGHDLESIATGEKPPTRHFESETIDAIEALPMPTIAKIRGHCFTGGLELALACDLLVAADDARLGDTHG
ncbi:MAG: enoyl-CoA hydratase/isomerase family protein [Deltaproteobacteria bacterium]|nr:enoyl-CoA hydratase/isomerase family protein [Deltaproteobacteria bacterium]